MPSPRSRLGVQGESVAAAHLVARGMRIIERNFRCRYGEVDLIAEENGVLVFVEVKTRRSMTHGAPEESVTPRKARRLALAAQTYLQQRGAEHCDWRVDLVAIALVPSGPASVNHLRGIEVEG